MKRKLAIGVGAALALSAFGAAPAMAAQVNPAASLSVAKARVGGSTAKNNKLAGGGLLAALIAAGVVAIGVVAIVNDDNSDSN